MLVSRVPVLAIATCVLLLAAAGRARAQTSTAPDDERAPVADASGEWEWYGWQTLIADGASLAMTPLVVGVFGFWLATPAVHAGHGRWGIAAASAAIRLTVTLVPALLWMSSCFDIGFGGSSSNGALCDGLTALAVIGVLGSVVLDAAAFAYDPPERRERSAVQLAPWARASAASAAGGLHLSGRF